MSHLHTKFRPNIIIHHHGFHTLFRLAQYSKPPEHTIEALSLMLQKNVEISLECAEEEQKDLFKEAEEQAKEPPSAARKEAEQQMAAELKALEPSAPPAEPEPAAANDAAPAPEDKPAGKRTKKAAAGVE